MIDPLTYEGLIDEWGNEYPQAGLYAQPEVQLAIERFLSSGPAFRDDHVLLWWLLGESTQVYKMSQEDAEYTDVSEVKGETCGNCVFAFKRVVDGKYICSQMRGFIIPPGWCRLWEGL